MTVEILAITTVRLLADQVKHFINSSNVIVGQVFYIGQTKYANELFGTES